MRTKTEKPEVAALEDAIPVTSIWKAIADFQQEVPIIHKDTQGYGYTYADLSRILQVITPYLKKHNLGFVQPLEANGQLRTVIFHTISNQSIESVVDIPQGAQLKGMNEFQVYGSAVTYFRRYALSSFLGLVTDKDLDAAGTQTTPAKQGLSNERYDKAVEAIKTGQYTKDELLENYQLTATQKIKLNEL
jgi:hypothetical protein